MLMIEICKDLLAVQAEKGRRPSFESNPVGPNSEDIGGAATIPSTNVEVKTAAPEAASHFDEEHGSVAKVISSSGSAVSLEEEDGSHHEENRSGSDRKPASSSHSGGSIAALGRALPFTKGMSIY